MPEAQRGLMPRQPGIDNLASMEAGVDGYKAPLIARVHLRLGIWRWTITPAEVPPHPPIVSCCFRHEDFSQKNCVVPLKTGSVATAFFRALQILTSSFNVRICALPYLLRPNVPSAHVWAANPRCRC